MNKLLFFIPFFLLFVSVNAQEKLTIFDIARKGSLDQAKEVFAANPKSVVSVNEEGYSALVLATYRGNNEVAKFLIDNGSDINGISKMGTPLMAAVVKGNIEIAKVLLEKKANPNITDANGTTALIYATMFGNVELIKMLLQYKSDKSIVDNKGKTAFEHAVFSGNQETIKLLK
jgi:uncharacterized protein